MAQKIDDSEMVSFKELLMANSIQVDQLSDEGSDELLIECREKSGYKSLDDVCASVFILKEVWKKIAETHRLRVVK